MKKTVLLLSSIALLCSCGPSRKIRATHKTIDTVTVSASNNPMDIYREASPRAWNIQHTRVALSFDYAARTAQGHEWISLQPYFYATDSLWLDAKSMKISSVTIGQQDKALKYTYEDDILKIRLDRTYSREETVKLSIQYTAMPYGSPTGGSKAISDDRGLYFINTDNKVPGKPVQIWTQGETEANSHWLPTIDKPNSRTSIQLELTVPAQYKTLSNGELISSMDKGTTRTDIWRTEQRIQVYAIMFAIGDFAVVKDKWKDKEVHYYVEPEYAPYARGMFKNTPEMIGFFSEVTGVPYPWNKYHQVVVRDYVSGAMENTSASLFGEFMNENNRELADKDFEDVVSHELFHQWFGDYVTAESWSNLTVNESFANYGEQLWRKYKYGSDHADELAYEDLQKYLNSTGYRDPVLVRFHYHDHEDMFDRVSYQKGGATLRYLHALIGDSAFYKAMNIYLTRNAYQPAEATHWRLAVEEATGKDWTRFFNEWYYRPGHPVLDITYQYDDAARKLNVTVTQVQETGLYQLPLRCVLLSGSRKDTLSWNLEKKTHTYTYTYGDTSAPVLIPDADHVLPGLIRENKNYKQWLQQLSHAGDFNSRLNAVTAVRPKDLDNLEVQALLRMACSDKNATIRLAAVNKIMKVDRDPQRKQWNGDLVLLAMNDGNNRVRAAAIYALGLWKEKGQKALILEALKDSSYLVAGNALYALNRIAPDTAYVLAKTMLNDKPNTNLDRQAWAVLAARADAKDTTLFRQYTWRQKGGQQDYLMSYLALYTSSTKDYPAYRSGLLLLADMIGKVENKNARGNYAELLGPVNNRLLEKARKDRKDQVTQDKLAQLKMVITNLKNKETEKDLVKIYDGMLAGKVEE